MSSYDLAGSHDERSSKFVEIALDDEGHAKPTLIIVPRRIFWIAVSVVGVGVLGLFIGIIVLSTEKSELTSKLSEMKAQMQHEQTTHVTGSSIRTSTGSSIGTSTGSSIGTSTGSPRVWSKTLGALQMNQNLEFSLSNNSNYRVKWNHSVPHSLPQETEDCSSDNTTNICIVWSNNVRLNVTKVMRPLLSGDMECYVVEWDALNDVSQTLSDCFDIDNSYWYGGYEDTHQYWPFEKNTMPLSSYTTHDAFKNGIGNVQDRYFVSSQGVGLLVGTDVPLYFSLNDTAVPGKMCFMSKYEGSPYFNVNKLLPRLNYTLCQEEDVVTIQKKMTEAFIRSPNWIPNPSLFKYPIWSTWAQYHTDINQTTVLDFTNNILDRNFTCSQIEIDDNWTPTYGDFEFDTEKFPNISGMVRYIQSRGCAVTAWVHPFFNSDSEYFQIAQNYSYLLRNISSDSAALTSWWDGNSTGVLDVSNPLAVSWYLDILNDLRKSTGIDSFKFDAGELSWLPKLYNATELPANPSDNYPTRYVEMAVNADRNFRQEVRSAYKTQRYPIFVRQIDKRSTWDHNNGLLSVIPGVLTFGILGYPFVLPDMIGGNAYDGLFPSSELFVRWIQLNTFLPAMQFSIVPWDPRFNDSSIDVVAISHEFVELHTNISEVLLQFANETLTSVNPIIRPLWWIDPTHITALTCEDEFLVGDYFLVAPVVQEGQRSRDIYIPSGEWVDMLRGDGTVYTGPTVLTNYSVAIEELAYFKNKEYM